MACGQLTRPGSSSAEMTSSVSPRSGGGERVEAFEEVLRVAKQGQLQPE
jgi:hypothetical protein